jgi:hypothetical protein
LNEASKINEYWRIPKNQYNRVGKLFKQKL